MERVNVVMLLYRVVVVVVVLTVVVESHRAQVLYSHIQVMNQAVCGI